MRTILSICPLVAGWNGAEHTCQIPFPSINSRNSSNVKAIRLSDTRVSGSPWVTKIFWRGWMPAVADVVVMGLTSNYFEYESTVTKKVCPWNGFSNST